jgi:RimJ/RimL family protein N-acetyltransferase
VKGSIDSGLNGRENASLKKKKVLSLSSRGSSVVEIYIRPLKERDALFSYKWRNDPIVWKYTGSRPDRTITQEMELEWIRDVLKRKNEKRFAICIKENDKYVGNAHLSDITIDSAQYHIFIGDTNYWGKGIATIVTRMVLQYAFDVIRVKEVYSFFLKDNVGSIVACKKAGFVFKEDISENEMKMICTPESLILK